MKKLIILSFTLMLVACSKPKPTKDIVTTSEPTGFIDSLSNTECRDLPKPVKHD